MHHMTRGRSASWVGFGVVGGGLARPSPKIHGILQDTVNKREVPILVKFKIGPFQDKYKTIHEGRFSVWHRSIINHLFVFPPKIN